MTLRAQGPPELSPAEPAAPSALAPPAFAVSGVVVGGTADGDAIVLSQRALALLRAGLLIRAFVISGLESLRRVVVLGARSQLQLLHGIYRVV